jgi:hypothetical protein
VALFPSNLRHVLLPTAVSKTSLDIICKSAFGYTADSLHNPHDELSEVYHTLLSLQSGTLIPSLYIFFCMCL